MLKKSTFLLLALLLVTGVFVPRTCEDFCPALL